MSRKDYQTLIDQVQIQSDRAQRDHDRAALARMHKDASYFSGERDGYQQVIRMLRHQQEHVDG